MTGSGLALRYFLSGVVKNCMIARPDTNIACDLPRRDACRNCRKRPTESGRPAGHQRAGREKARSLWRAGAAGLQRGGLTLEHSRANRH